MSEKRRKMVKVLIAMPADLRDELNALKQETGLTVSQQARTSLTIWVARCRKTPGGAQALFARGMAGLTAIAASESPTSLPGAHKGYLDTIGPTYDPATDPQPDREREPAKWASWSKRQGDYAVSLLARGIWPIDQTKD